MREVTESSKYHSRNQEHNLSRCKGSQRVDHTVIESRMTRSVNRNSRVYKISEGDKGHSEIERYLARRLEFISVESTVIL